MKYRVVTTNARFNKNNAVAEFELLDNAIGYMQKEIETTAMHYFELALDERGWLHQKPFWNEVKNLYSEAYSKAEKMWDIQDIS